jgi:hypothetical protein
MSWRAFPHIKERDVFFKKASFPPPFFATKQRMGDGTTLWRGAFRPGDKKASHHRGIHDRYATYVSTLVTMTTRTARCPLSRWPWRLHAHRDSAAGMRIQSTDAEEAIRSIVSIHFPPAMNVGCIIIIMIIDQMMELVMVSPLVSLLGPAVVRVRTSTEREGADVSKTIRCLRD